MSSPIRLLCLLAAFCTLAVTSCAAPSTASGAMAPATEAGPPPAASAPSASPQATAAPALPPAPPMSDPLPPEEVRAPVTIDQSCRVAADCAVKNVGNCCGAMPACVNKDSPTDAAAVQAECARKGMASVCGFVEIRACSCIANRCVAEQAPEPATR